MKKLFFVWLLLAMIIALAACQPQPTATTEIVRPVATDTPQPKPTATAVPPTSTPTLDPSILLGGTLARDAVLDPALAVDAQVLDVCSKLYLGLVTLDASGNPVPALAESWTISDDELDIVFSLRRNATFSDGTQIDADVVVQNFYRSFDPNNPLHGQGTYQGWKENFLGFLGEMDADGKPIAIVDGMEKVDNYTVLLHLNRREPDILKKLALPYFAVLSPKALEAGGYGVSAESVVSSGPYSVAIWDTAQLLLEPNAAYWGPKPDQKMKFDLQ